jgi:hypothetical protein
MHANRSPERTIGFGIDQVAWSADSTACLSRLRDLCLETAHVAVELITCP